MTTRRSQQVSAIKKSSKYRQFAREKARRLHLEQLEDRRVMAADTPPVFILPNSGILLGDGDVRNVAPKDLTFRFNSLTAVDPSTLATGIRLTRSGGDGLFGQTNDQVIVPGFIGIGDNQREVIMRFAETLPDDVYRIEVIGSGAAPLRDTAGAPFNLGVNYGFDFNLDLGAQVIAVVPQPIVRTGTTLTQRRDQIVVYFNDDDLLQTAGNAGRVSNPQLYRLFATRNTLDPTDDVEFLPTSVVYNAATDSATLTFASNIDQLLAGTLVTNQFEDQVGAFRLRIGTTETARATTQTIRLGTADPGSSFATALPIDGTLVAGTQGGSVAYAQAIEEQPYNLDWPGGNDEPGHRDIPTQGHLADDANTQAGGAPNAGDNTDGITTVFYNFKQQIGVINSGIGGSQPAFNLISENQKARAREIFDLLSRYAGVQFVESESQGLIVATGDMRAVGTPADGEGGTIGTFGLNAFLEPVVLLDSAESWNDQISTILTTLPGQESWFQEAMRNINLFLGLGANVELPGLQAQGADLTLQGSAPLPEPVLPGDADIVHLQHLYRPESKDIDLYTFTVPAGQSGLFTVETFAERLPNSSTLDTHVAIYRVTATGEIEIIARNDDYFSKDSYVNVNLTAGTYYVGVSASGNDKYDGDVVDSGMGGTTQGKYEIKFDFRKTPTGTLVDSTGVAFDGDNDGLPGGVHNFWFRSAAPMPQGTTVANRPANDASRTIFVDKRNTQTSQNGSIQNPFSSIPSALAAARPNDIVRIVGNEGTDNVDDGLNDVLAYRIGFDTFGNPLADGANLQVPKDVTVMIDAGAVFQMRRSQISVGSTAPSASSDRSGGALQVLGTPTDNVYFTSYNENGLGSIGLDQNPLNTIPTAGDWGGISFQNDLDRADGRFNFEESGIFLNHVNNADIRYGGGQVIVDSVSVVVTPIFITDSRPTISYNTITRSAVAAMSANPDSFEETNFQAPKYWTSTTDDQSSNPGISTRSFTLDYSRVGPDIQGNRLRVVENAVVYSNTINGLFIRTSTPAGATTEELTVTGRFDDTDIVHILQENLTVRGQAGGSFVEESFPPAALIIAAEEFVPAQVSSATPGFAAGSQPEYKITYVDLLGNEGVASETFVTTQPTLDAGSFIRLTQLPVPTGSFVARNLYRREISTGRYVLVDQIAASTTEYVDRNVPQPAEKSYLNVAAADDVALPDTTNSTITESAGGAYVVGTTVRYELRYVNATGLEGPPLNPFALVPPVQIPGVLFPAFTVTTPNAQITLSGLPVTPSNPSFVDPPLGSAAPHNLRVYRSVNGGDFELLATLLPGQTSLVDTGAAIANPILMADPTATGTTARPRPDANLVIDPAIVVKSDGARIDVGVGASLIAEGQAGLEVVLTSLSDDRYGAGGTFDTGNDGGTSTSSAAQEGDWAGIYFSPDSSGSIDRAVIAYGGGLNRIEGNFAGFNVIEIRQADVRIANSEFEFNADGTGGQAPADRFGRGFNEAATIFVRGAQPVILNNAVHDDESAFININVNSLTSELNVDTGRQSGFIGRFAGYQDNNGPLIRGNRLQDNGINGMVVRGAVLTTEVVWDDTDIAHVLFDTIVIPDLHTFGGLRLESSGTESLVVKSSGVTAGFVATGRPLEIDDRIGGVIHVLGQPGFPVVLTSFSDDTASAGIDLQGNPQNDTNGDGIGSGLLPTGPEVNNGLLIDNDVAIGTVGQFAYNVGPAGSSNFGGGVTAQGQSMLFANQDFIFEFLNYVDVGSDGLAIDLSTSTITQAPTLLSDDLVESRGTFQGQNGLITWIVQTRLDDGVATVFNTITFTSTAPLGNLQFINYLDEDVLGISDDVLYRVGSPGQADFRLFTLDGQEKIGFAQGGIYTAGPGLVNATYTGWAADEYSDLSFAIETAGTTYSPTGNVDLVDLPVVADPDLGNVNGPADVTTAMAWTVNPTATTATITTFLELIARNPVSSGTAGEWQGIVIDQYSHDRNVETVLEQEPAVSDGTANNSPSKAQYLGGLASAEKNGDENLRLGFTVHGLINRNDDIDVYSFKALPGTEVWFDIDRTSVGFDAVIELVDENGIVLARSNNSTAENSGAEALFGTARDMQKTPPYQGQDFYTTNVKDPGMRIVLAGPAGQQSTYHIRVRSNTTNLLANPPIAGQTNGAYQLQVRLREVDEFGGSTVRYADIRNAVNGIAVLGQPAHSPLAGERAETTANNNTFATAQNLGNLLTSDRGTLSVAGSLSAFNDVDWYRITLDNTLPTQAAFWNAIFDIDYADGLARPNTALYVFDELGRLILTSRDSNIAEDRPSAAPGSGISDLSRGSAGGGDPYIGTVALPTNFVNPQPIADATEFYYVAISSDLQMPAQLEQFFQANASNPLLRLEPINSVQRIVEDHIGAFMTRSTASAPDVQVFIEAQNAVQHTISDVVLYINMSANDGTEQTRLVTVDPFTGDNETYLSNFARDTGDLVLREDNRLFSYTIDLDDNFTLDDAESGNYIELNTGTGAFTTIGDDGIITYESNLAVPPAAVVSNLGINNTRWGYGLQFNAMAYSDIGHAFDANGNQLSERLIAVGNRGDVNSNNPASTAIDRRQNIVYSMDANSGAAQITGAGARLSGSATGVYEVGEILTSSRLTFGTDATTGTGLAGFAVNDGLTFGVNTEASSTTFEFDAGFEVLQQINTATGQTIQDGYFFILDSDTTLGNQNEVLYQFDTGVVITVNPGLQTTGILDGSTFTVRVNGVPRVFEFDNTGAVTAGNILVNISGNFGADVIAARISNAIDTQTAAAFPVDGYVEPLGNRVSLIPTVATPTTITATLGTSSPYLTFQGANGTAPVLQGVDPAGIGEGTTFTVSNGVTNFTFEFDRDNVFAGGNFRVNIQGAVDSTAVAAAIEAAVATLPATSGLNATRFGDRVIVNGQGVTFSRQTSAVYSLTDNIANGGLQTVQVSVEERDGSAVVGAAVLAAMNTGNPRFAAGAAFDRINFPPITTGGLTPVASIDISAVPVWSPVAGSAPGVAGGREQIPFLASDTANQLANRAVTAINAALNATEGITAQFSGGNVELNRGTFTIGGATTALTVNGEGPGGNITGIVDITPPPNIAQGMNTLIRYYLAVSDNGGLYLVELNLLNNQNITPNSAGAIFAKTNQVRTTYIGSSADSLSGIAFQALTKGPENVEGGRYQDVWYAVADGPGNGDNQSRLHAFNFDATFETPAEWNAFRTAFLTNNTAALNARFTGRAPVFVDGATSIPLFYTVPQGAEGNPVPIRRPVTDAKGIAFSSLDQNLWKQTTTRAGDAGHEGGNSLVFGNDDQEQWAGNTYNFPGGASGSIVSNEFSLENYSVGDQPVLYYSYLGDTDGTNDSVRVYISGVNDADRDGVADNNPGQWTLLTQSGGSTYLNTGWRQVRLNLGDFAGWSNLRLRFDFSTAGEMNVGDAGTTGDELRAVDGKYIADGDIVTIGGTTFEFESGVTLTMPSGRAVNDGENFTIQINGAPQTYEFDKNGTQSIPGSTLIPVTNVTTAEQVTLLVRDAIVANQAGPGPVVTPRIEGGVEWIFPDASAYALIPDNQLQFTLDDGTNPPVTFEFDRDPIANNAWTPGTIRVEFSLAMDSARVALEVARAIQGYANGLQTGDNLHVTASYRQPNIVQIEGLVDYNANFALQLLKETPYSGNRLNLQGAEAFTQSAVHAIVATGAVGVANLNRVPVNIHMAMRARDVAQSFDAVLETAFRNQQLVVQNGSSYEDGQVFDIDHDGDGGLVTPDIRFEIETGLMVSIPGNGAVGPGGVADGDTITISNGGAPVTFEFTTDAVLTVPTNVPVTFRATDSQAVIARAFEAAINGQGALGIVARVVSGSRIQLSSGAFSPNLTFATSDVAKYNTGNTFAGVAVGNTPIIVSPTAQFTAQQMAAAVAAAINAAGVLGFSAQTNATVPNQVELLSTDVRVSALDSIGLTIPAPQPINGTGVAPGAPNIAFETGVFDIAKRERDLMRIIGRNVTARGPLGLQSTGMTGELPDHFENGNGIVAGFTSSLRGQDNNHEGFYIDDIIIGLAERGESASGATTATGFVTNPLGTGNTSGAYQLEIRRGPAYDRFIGTNPGETANSNDRYAQEYTIVAKSGAELADGVTFTLSDGISRVTFEFDEVALPGRPALPVAVTPGNQRIAFSSTDTADEVAVRIRDAINSSQVQAVLKLTAGLADGTLVGNVTTSNRVNVVGAATVAIEGRNAVEVNDTLSQAVATNFNGTQYFAQGTIGDNPELSVSRDTEGHDVDLFSIRLSAGQTIRIDIDTENLNFSSEVGNLLDTVLRIFDSTGAELASSDDDFAPGEERSFDLTTTESYLEFRAPHASGTVTYYIGVSGFGNQTYSFPNATTVTGTESSTTLGFYQLEISTALTSSLEIEKFEEELGDKNLFRDQGQILLYGNTVSNSSQWGILVNNGTRTAADGNAAHQGPVRNLREQNIDRLVPGVVIANNVIFSNNAGGIRYSGDGGIDAPVSFGRIINNTLYGSGANDIGIQVDQGASPTLLNNIVANFGQGVNVDASSGSTVLGGMVYQNNTSNSNIGLGGDFPIALAPTEPLFVNAGLRNFYPAPGSRVIDSSVGSLLDRTSLVTVKNPMGIGLSPIIAPDRDALGQLRTDDPAVSTANGFGLNPNIDRGAIDRVDFTGPTSILENPRDNDAEGLDLDPTVSVVTLENTVLNDFTIRLVDRFDVNGPPEGSDIDDFSVTGDKVTVTSTVGTTTVTLVEGVDYSFSFDATNNIIRLTPLGGLWPLSRTYRITLDNSVTNGIRDLAGNILAANQTDGQHYYTIFLGSAVDWGDLPQSYGTLAAGVPVGPSHQIVGGIQLGPNVSAEPDGQPEAVFGDDADNDGGDDGIQFVNLQPSAAANSSQIIVTATATGFLSAWFDYNRNGTFDTGEQVLANEVVGTVPGQGEAITFQIPDTVAKGEIYARFRYSTSLVDSPFGALPDGEVEDYRLTLTGAQFENTIPNDFNNDGINDGHLDVTADGAITPLDALVVINYLNLLFGTYGSSIPLPNPLLTSPLPPPPGVINRYVDTNGDGRLTAFDALQVINYLNANLSNGSGAGGEGEPEGEPASAQTMAAPAAFAAPASISVVAPASVDIDYSIPAVLYGTPSVVVEVRERLSTSSVGDASDSVYDDEFAALSLADYSLAGVGSSAGASVGPIDNNDWNNDSWDSLLGDIALSHQEENEDDAFGNL